MPAFRVRLKKKEIERRVREFYTGVVIEAKDEREAQLVVDLLNANTNKLMTEVDWSVGEEDEEQFDSQPAEPLPEVVSIVEDIDVDDCEIEYYASEVRRKYRKSRK